MHSLKYLIFILIIALSSACGGGGGDGSSAPAKSKVKVSWNPNPDTAVNRSGGGYKIYYSLNSGFTTDDTGVTEIDVPYVSGSVSPTSIQIKPLPPSGTYYLRIAAYSALDAPGLSGGSISIATTQNIFSVP